MGRKHRSPSAILLENQKKEAQLWFEEANCHLKGGNLQKALVSYSKALELNPTEKHCLAARSRCYIQLAQPENGLKDAEAALAIDKNFIKGIYQKAESLYYLGDFEHSLMYYHRGLRLRPEHEGFKLGVHKSQKAIENAIGSKTLIQPAPAPIRSELDFFNNNNIHTDDNANITISKGRAATATPNKQSQKGSNGQGRPRTAKHSRLLRELAPDKVYLEGLMKNPNLTCKCKEDDDTILHYIKDAVDFLNNRQEFWRQQLPPHLKY